MGICQAKQRQATHKIPQKRKYAKYEEYVGADEVGQQIREYGNSNYGKPIIVQDEITGAMMYLRYGKSI